MAIIAKYGLNGNANALVGSNGTANAVTWVDGKSNGAGSFNGSSSRIDANISLGNVFSIGFWYNPNNNPNTTFQNTLRGGVSTTESLGYSHSHENNDFRQAFFITNTSGTYFPNKINTTITAGNWYYLVMTFNNNDFKTYCNGILQNTVTTTGTIRSTSLIKLGCSLQNNAFFPGLIDELIIHNTALTPAEIKNKYLFYNGFI